MKKIFQLMILLVIAMPVFSQLREGNLIPVTTNSKSALLYYSKANKYFDEVKVKEALENFKKALNEDPDFFMANYQLAFYYLLNQESDNFFEYANVAKNCKAELSEGEELL